MCRLKLLTTIAVAAFMLTGCPEPDPNREIAIVIPAAQVSNVTTKGKDIAVVCFERLEQVTWSVVNKPEGSHPVFTDVSESENRSDAGYYKHFKTDKAGAYTIKVDVAARGKTASKTADMNVTEAK